MLNKKNLKFNLMTHSHQIFLYKSDIDDEEVIHCLMIYCGHTYIQASQCLHITKHNGKCEIVRGDIDNLTKIENELLLCDINVKIIKS